ncbi:MAG: iron-sulfur cluster assembly protein IscA [Steroidobacteraceae bacterium]
MSVTLTEKAARRVRESIAKRGSGIGLRLGVRTAGCSGLAYTMEFADSRQAQDCEFESQGVTLLIDPRSLPYLAGTELDFVREGLNEGFKFHNPNSKAQCGCGESFTV